MLVVEIPPALEKRLEVLAKKAGKSKQDLALEAIVEQIGDLEDSLVALERLNDGNAEWLSLEEVKAQLGMDDLSERFSH